MPAKPKRGTVPSLDGDGVDKRNAFVKRKFHFRTIPAQRPHIVDVWKHAPLLRLRDPAHFRTPAHSSLLFAR